MAVGTTTLTLSDADGKEPIAESDQVKVTIYIHNPEMLDLTWEGLDEPNEEDPGAFIGIGGSHVITLQKDPSIDEMKLVWNGDKIEIWDIVNLPPGPISSGQPFDQDSVSLVVIGVEASSDTVLTLSDTSSSVPSDIVKVTVINVDLDIYDGGKNGLLVNGNENREEIRGAFTVANLNDTDDDGTVDINDNDVSATANGRDEVDLIKLILHKPDPDLGDKVKLKVVSGNVKIWEQSKKVTEIVLTGGEVEYDTTDLDKPLWVEAREKSNNLRDIVIELEYKGCKDTVKATAVWAEKTGFKNELTDTMWVDAGNPLISSFDTACGGKFGIQFSTPPVEIKYTMGMEFEVSPSGIGNEEGVVFDVTRQIEYKQWYINGITVTEWMPWETFPLDDTSNDDTNQDDEDNTPSNNHIYSIDGVGLLNNGLDDQEITRNNFYEFVRVRFDGNGLSGENSEGSRCSLKYKWHAFQWVEKDGTEYKMRVGKTNEIEEGHLPLGEAPTP